MAGECPHRPQQRLQDGFGGVAVRTFERRHHVFTAELVVRGAAGAPIR
jgi:hypothetical protein